VADTLVAKAKPKITPEIKAFFNDGIS